jgi:kumamolisin
MSNKGNASKEHIPIVRSERVPVPTARLVGPANPKEEIKVLVQLRSQRDDERTAHVERLASMRPVEREYISRKEYATTFAATTEDIEKIKTFAKEYGLSVIEASAWTVKLSGTVASFSKAFGVKLKRYRYPGGEYRGREGPIRIPAYLTSVVQGVYGLDNRIQVRPFFRSGKIMTKDSDIQTNTGSGPYDPTVLAKLYNFPTGLDGSNQCIGILEFGGGFTDSDLKSYFSELGQTTPKVSVVSVGDARNEPDGTGLHTPGADAEVLLDIEVAAAIAPKAEIVVYFGDIRDPGFEEAVHTAIHDSVHDPSVISISWGSPEIGWVPKTMDNMNKLFQDAALLMGITTCCASGDDGSSSERPSSDNNFEIEDDLAHVTFPASSPYVLACGGTKLESSGGIITSETVWNENSIGGGATGGGISDFFDVPDYQKDIGVPHSVNSGGRIGRGVPDVSANAAQIPGYRVRVDGDEGGIGGTSAVAPLWAGLLSLITQHLDKKVGFLNPLLYENASSGAFKDIVIGDNIVIQPVRRKGQVNVKGYKARRGWDACTGLGSPDGAKVLAVLKQIVG